MKWLLLWLSLLKPSLACEFKFPHPVQKVRKLQFEGRCSKSKADGWGLAFAEVMIQNRWYPAEYEGVMILGQAKGRGFLKIHGLFSHQGPFHSLANGEGTRHYKVSGHLLQGKFSEGFLNTTATLKYANKDRYIGQFQMDLPHGEGRLQYSNGDLYIGQFHEGQVEGLGTLKKNNGDLYEGQFVDGLLHGKGTYRSASLHETYHGDFQNQLYEGQGRLHKEQRTCRGAFEAGRVHGQATCSEKLRRLRGRFVQGRLIEGRIQIEGGYIVEGRFHPAKNSVAYLKTPQGTTLRGKLIQNSFHTDSNQTYRLDPRDLHRAP